MNDNPLMLDSITDATPAARGRVVVSGSHGGMYPAAIASHAGVHAALFNDAGIGLDRAGVAGVLALAETGMAAAGVDCQSCHIGSAGDALARGVISVTNPLAHDLGIRPGMAAREAALLLAHAPEPHIVMAPVNEARQVVDLGQVRVHCLDSASLVGPQDEGRIVITGSHGGLIGGDPARAIKAAVRVAVFNDAGIGSDRIGVSRLPALDARAVAAVTVSCETARIGDALSALKSGVISCTNRTADALGCVQNGQLANWLARLS